MLDFSSQRFKGIYILIPAFNEEKGIASLLESLLELGVPKSNILLFDDASNDNTCSIAATYDIPIEKNRINSGKGKVLRKGFSNLIAKGADWIITMDGDGQHSVEDLPGFIIDIQNSKDCGIIIGNRSKTLKEMPPARIFSNVVTSKFISTVLGTDVKDCQCGYRAYNTKMLKKVKLQYTHFELETEVIIKSVHAGFPIKNRPISTIYRSDTKSNISHILDTYRWLKALIFTLLKLRFKREC